jgi:hypothetical protein
MTLNRLCKILEELRAENGRCRVSIAKESFRDNRENDGCTILMVYGVDVRWINDADDDGGTAVNKDGSERGRTTVILFGDSYERG